MFYTCLGSPFNKLICNRHIPCTKWVAKAPICTKFVALAVVNESSILMCFLINLMQRTNKLFQLHVRPLGRFQIMRKMLFLYRKKHIH